MDELTYERMVDRCMRKRLVHDLRRCNDIMYETEDKAERIIERILEIDEKWGEA